MRKRDLLTGNVLWLSVVSLLNDTASEMIYPLLPLFLVGTLGAGAAFVGVIEGMAESTASLLKLASGWWSDRVHRRKPLVVWGYSLATFARPLVGVTTAPWQVLVIRVADRAGKGIRTAPRDALLAESVPETHRGRAFGLHRAADHLGAVMGPLLASALLVLLANDLRVVFLLALIPGLLALVVLWTRVGDVRTPGVAAATPAPIMFREVFHGRFRRFVFAISIFALANATDAFLLLRASELGVPVAAIPLLWGVLHVSKSVFSVPGGALADRAGARTALLAGWLLYALVSVGFALANTALHAWLLFMVYGLYFGLTESPAMALVASLSPSHVRGSAFGAYHFVVGVAALPASVLFGVLWQRYDPQTAFYVAAVLALLAAFALLTVRTSQPESAGDGVHQPI
jgi:MFS family permease